MKNILLSLLLTMSSLSAAAQSDATEPRLPPMKEPAAFIPRTAPFLRMRGMNIDDGYGILHPYGAARLFGGTPAHDHYMDGMRHRTVSAYTLWPGIGLSFLGVVTIASAGEFKDDGFGDGKEFRNSIMGTGVAMLAVGLSATAVGAVFRVKAKRSIARAVDAYNRYTGASLHDSRVPELSIGLIPGGVGMALRF